jgi:hypothetical protein
MALQKELMGQGGMFVTQAQSINGSLATAITAFATGGQASATQLNAVTNVISVCATGADSVKLPVATTGDEVFIRNNGAASCNVFPQTGGNLNNAGANTAFAVANAKSAVFKCISGTAGDWIAVLSA